MSKDNFYMDSIEVLVIRAELAAAVTAADEALLNASQNGRVDTTKLGEQLKQVNGLFARITHEGTPSKEEA